MLITILEKIKERLETVSGLKVFYDEKQSEKVKSPIAVINFESQSPKDENWKHSTKYQVSLSVTIELVHTAFLDLLDLIEAVESALKISEKLERNYGLGLSRLD